MKCHSSTERKDVLPFVTTRTDLEGIRLRENNPGTERPKMCHVYMDLKSGAQRSREWDTLRSWWRVREMERGVHPRVKRFSDLRNRLWGSDTQRGIANLINMEVLT